MSICLNMIVRNEARNISRLFGSIKDVIDYYVILDTGSTDRTIEVIAEVSAGHKIAGKVFSAEWKPDFGFMRQQALDRAKIFSPCSHILIMDADEEFVGRKGHWQEALKNNVSYRVPKFYGRFRNDHINLISQTSEGFWWTGALHEELLADPSNEIEVFHWGKIISHPNEGVRSRGKSVDEKLRGDLEKLRGMLEEHRSERTLFYLAQTYKDLREYRTAAHHYCELIAYGGCGQRKYRALLGYASCLEALHGVPKDIADTLISAINTRPGRLEAYYYLSKLYLRESSIHLAYIFAKAGLEYLYTSDNYMLESDIYEWRHLALYCRICLMLGKNREMEELYESLLDDTRPTHNTIEFANEKMNLVSLHNSFGEPSSGE